MKFKFLIFVLIIGIAQISSASEKKLNSHEQPEKTRKSREAALKATMEREQAKRRELATLNSIANPKYKESEKLFKSGNTDAAMALLAEAAKLGHSEAQYKLGLMYLNGFGFKKNNTKALKWLQLASRNGHKKAKPDLSEAISLEYKSSIVSCSQNKNHQACFYIGHTYFNEGIFEKAKKYLNMACEGSHPKGCYFLASIYRRGMGSTDKNSDLAAKYLKIACNLGDKYSCNYAGGMFAKGSEVEKNELLAFEYYKKACNLGVAMGCYKTGDHFHKGIGCKKNIDQAIKYYEKACDYKIKHFCISTDELKQTAQ